MFPEDFGTLLGEDVNVWWELSKEHADFFPDFCYAYSQMIRGLDCDPRERVGRHACRYHSHAEECPLKEATNTPSDFVRDVSLGN